MVFSFSPWVLQVLPDSLGGYRGIIGGEAETTLKIPADQTV